MLWPLFGFAFETKDLGPWASNILHALVSNPEVYVPEAVGLLILLWFGLALAGRKKIDVLVRYGKVP